MKYFIVSTLLLFVLLLTGGIVYLPSHYPIANIVCLTPTDSCSDDILSKLKSLEGKNWQDVKLRTISLLANNPEVREYSIRFKLPNTMVIYVVENKVLYAIHLSGQNIYYLIDGQGMVIKIGAENSLPFIDYSDKLPNVGEKIDGKLVFALETVNSIYYSYQVKGAVVENDNLNILLPEGITVIFPLAGDQKALLGSFKLIIDRLKASKLDNADNLGKISIVDLRFKNPVLK